MKAINLFYGALILLAFTGCSSDYEGINPATDVTNGAVVERIITTSNELLMGSLDGSLNTQLEYRDAEGGTLLDEMQVFVTFYDNSEGLGDSSGATVGSEAAIRTVDASLFSNGANGFPVYKLMVSTQEFLDATSNTLEEIATDDRFVTRLALLLTDGRIFSTSNIANNGGLNTDFAIVTNVE